MWYILIAAITTVYQTTEMTTQDSGSDLDNSYASASRSCCFLTKSENKNNDTLISRYHAVFGIKANTGVTMRSCCSHGGLCSPACIADFSYLGIDSTASFVLKK